MNKRKAIAAALSLMVCSILLNGCQTGKTEEISQETDVTGISFSWWGNDVRHFYTMNAVDQFQAENPDIHVKYRYSVWNGFEKRTKVYMESHTETDVMQINYAWLSQYSPDGEGYYDLYQLSDEIDLDNFTSEDFSYGEIQGKLNALPIAINTYTNCVNRDLFRKYGLDIPTTWDDYFEAASVMKADGIYPLGVMKKQLTLLLIAYYEQNTGKQVFSSDGKFLLDEKGMEFILDFYKKLLDEKVLMPVTEFDRSKFSGQTTACAINWISDAGNYCKELAENGVDVTIGSFPMAADAKRSGKYLKPATMYAISKNTDHPKEAARLLNFLLNSSVMALEQGTEKGVPVSKAAVEVLKEHDMLQGFEYMAYEKMMEERQDMDLMVPAMENESVIDAFKEGADEYIYGKQDRTACARAICEKIREITG